jgi:MoaD family protein
MLVGRLQRDGPDEMVRVRLFAALRELAGASEVEAEGRTAGEVADALSARFGERFGQIAAVGSLVVNGERADRTTAVAEGDEVALLPPVSGGALTRNSPV